MSKTSNYSFLLLRSSKRLQKKVLSRFDEQAKQALLVELEKTPNWGVSKIRSLKAMIIGHQPVPSLHHKRQETQPSVKCEVTERAVKFLVTSEEFALDSTKAARSFYHELGLKNKEWIERYLASGEGEQNE